VKTVLSLAITSVVALTQLSLVRVQSIAETITHKIYIITRLPIYGIAVMGMEA